MGKAMDFYFGLHIHKLHPNKRPLKIFHKKKRSRDWRKLSGNPYYLRNGLSYGLLVQLVHSQGPSERKAIKISAKRKRWRIQGLSKLFRYPLIISGMGKAKDF